MQKNHLLHFEKMFKTMISNAITKSMDMNCDFAGGDSADQAIDEREKALSLKLKGREDFYLKKVMNALDRIKEGSFGSCEDCDQDIEEGRLLARPTAILCISCKEGEEKIENQILYNKKSHTHGKTFINNNIINIGTVKSTEEQNLAGNVINFPGVEENKMA